MLLRDILPENLTEEQALQELQDLAAELSKLDKAYYQDDAPLLDDWQYDVLKKRNEEMKLILAK